MPLYWRVNMTSEKSIACWPADETLTMRAGADALISGSSSYLDGIGLGYESMN